MTASKQRWIVIITASLAIHAVFCTQAISAARSGTGGFVTNEFFLLAFLPHYIVMYFLPPNWPIISGTDIDWWRVAEKLAVSYPASLLRCCTAGWWEQFGTSLIVFGIGSAGVTRMTSTTETDPPILDTFWKRVCID